MSDETQKVCPNCGNDSFTSLRIFIYNAIVDGNGMIVDKGKLLTTGVHEEAVYKCTDCESIYEDLSSLVSEAYFHEVIVTQERG